MFYGLHRNRSGFVRTAPALGNFDVTDAPSDALRFWTRSAAERFKAKHRGTLRGGWAVVPVSKLHAFALGVREGFEGLATGVTYEGDPESARSRAYDRGRNLGEFFGRFRRA